MSNLFLFRDSTIAPEATDPPPERLVTGQPKAETANVFESRDSKIFSGIWRATIGAWRVAYDETEYCYITKGRARLIEDGGPIKEVGAGDGFVIASGFSGIWEVVEEMEKHYVIVLDQ